MTNKEDMNRLADQLGAGFEVHERTGSATGKKNAELVNLVKNIAGAKFVDKPHLIVGTNIRCPGNAIVPEMTCPRCGGRIIVSCSNTCQDVIQYGETLLTQMYCENENECRVTSEELEGQNDLTVFTINDLR